MTVVRAADVGLELPALADESGPLLWRRAWPVTGASGHELTAEAVGRDERVRAAVLHRDGDRWSPELVTGDRRLPGLRSPLVSPQARLVAHRAGKRAVLRQDGYWVKVARRAATGRAQDRHQQVTALVAGRPGGPRLPGLLAVDRSAGILVLSHTSGRSVARLLAASTDLDVARGAGVVTGRAVAAMASAPAGTLPAHTLADEAAVVRRWADQAVRSGAVRGDAARVLLRTADEVARLLTGLPAADPVPSHRDLHDGQVLVDTADPRSPVAFLDLDTAADADPALDPANLLAHLDLLAIAAPARRAACAAFEAGLRAGLAAAGHPAATRDGVARLALLRRATLTRLAAVHAFRADAPRLVPALLHAASARG